MFVPRNREWELYDMGSEVQEHERLLDMDDKLNRVILPYEALTIIANCEMATIRRRKG